MATSWFKRLRKGKSRPAGRRRPARARLGVEALEVREVPTVSAAVNPAGVLVVSTDSGDDVTIDHVIGPLGPATTVNGRQFPDVQMNSIQLQGGFLNVFIPATVKPLTADGEGAVIVGSDGTPNTGNMQRIQAQLSLGSDNFVTLDDSNDPFGRNVTLNVVNEVVQVTNMAPAPISFNVFGGEFLFGVNDLDRLNLRGGRGRNTFNVLDTPNAFRFGNQETDTNIFTGPSGDSVNVLGTSSRQLNIIGQARDSVHIGNNGNLDAIQSAVEITNPRSFTALSVGGEAARSAQNVTLSVSNGFGLIHGLAPKDIDYDAAHVSTVVLFGGSHGNTFTVLDTHRNALGQATSIFTGAGNNLVNVLGTTGLLDVIGQGGHDQVNVGSNGFSAGHLTNIRGEVDVDNLGGQRSQLNVDASGDNVPHLTTLNNGDIEGLAGPNRLVPIKYEPSGVNFVTVHLGNETDQLFVFATPANVLTRIFGGSGLKLFGVSGNESNLDTIRGPLDFFGQGGHADLEVDDRNAPFGHTYQTPPGQIVRSGLGGPRVVIDFFNMQEVHLTRNRQQGAQAQDLALPERVGVGQPARLTGTLVDADPNQVLSLTVDWGDGSDPETSTPDRGPFEVTHRYASRGDYFVHVTWSDSDGVSNSDDLLLRVGPALRVVQVGGPGAFDGADAVFALLGADKGRHGQQ
jgi:hypothetical protein